MALSQVSEFGQAFVVADGDQTLHSLLVAAGIAVYDGLKSLEIRVESGGPVAVAIRSTAMTALTDGKQLSIGDSATERSVQYEQVDANHVRIYGSGAPTSCYIGGRGF